VQYGDEQRSLSIKQNLLRPSLRLTTISWFQDEKPSQGNTAIPDILKRGNDIVSTGTCPKNIRLLSLTMNQPGSAHSMLKMLPLLDALQDDTKPLGYVAPVSGSQHFPLTRPSATDLFTFEGPKKRPESVDAKFPEVIGKWPTLPPDPLSASLKPVDAARYRREGEEGLDEVDDRNTNSILCAGDDMGNIHCFLDGSFPLGTFLFNTNFPIASLYKKPDDPTFSINIRTAETGTCLAPTIVDMTLLKRRSVRDVARTSSTARELTWYIMRSVKEMQKFWYGQDLQGGARTMGPKWVEALEKKQTQFGRTSRVLHLTSSTLSPHHREAAIRSAGPIMPALDGARFRSSQRFFGERGPND
jgi:anaphase-promoting complex subunit 4